MGRKAILGILVILALGSSDQVEGNEGMDKLLVDSNTATSMREFIAQDKFGEDMDTFYPGVPDPELAVELNSAMDASLESILKVAQEQQSRVAVLEVIRSSLESFRKLALDSEDEERICWCYDKACQLLGIESTDGLFNKWLYGFDPRG